jgi:hypothetical protein
MRGALRRSLGMAKNSRPQKTNDRQKAALAVSTRQIAKEAVRGGPKSVKDKRPTGRSQKG